MRNSGSYARFAHDLEETVTFLQQANWQVELKLTESAGDGSRLAREAVEQKADSVIAAGGDGTINEIIQELAGSETALGVLPIGTVNCNKMCHWTGRIVTPFATRTLSRGDRPRLVARPPGERSRQYSGRSVPLVDTSANRDYRYERTQSRLRP